MYYTFFVIVLHCSVIVLHCLAIVAASDERVKVTGCFFLKEMTKII